MDILIPDSWLKDFLETDAKPSEIAKYLSLSGPSVERIIKETNDSIYSAEVTTNRVDSVSIYGFAREASAILPKFGKKAKFIPLKLKSKYNFFSKVNYLNVTVNSKLCTRFTAVLIKSVKIKDSPQYIKERLTKIGLRPINNIVDISNYVMHELGQPLHTFDYDKIKGAKMKYDLMTKLGDLLKDPQAMEIIEKYVPGLAKNPLIRLVKGKKLESLLDIPQAKEAGLTKEMLEKLLEEINAKKADA